MLCIPRLRIAILNEEIALWEKRCGNEPNYYLFEYIRDTMKGRVKELEENERLDQEKDNGTKCK